MKLNVAVAVVTASASTAGADGFLRSGTAAFLFRSSGNGRKDQKLATNPKSASCWNFVNGNDNKTKCLETFRDSDDKQTEFKVGLSVGEDALVVPPLDDDLDDVDTSALDEDFNDVSTSALLSILEEEEAPSKKAETAGKQKAAERPEHTSRFMDSRGKTTHGKWSSSDPTQASCWSFADPPKPVGRARKGPYDQPPEEMVSESKSDKDRANKARMAALAIEAAALKEQAAEKIANEKLALDEKRAAEERRKVALEIKAAALEKKQEAELVAKQKLVLAEKKKAKKQRQVALEQKVAALKEKAAEQVAKEQLALATKRAAAEQRMADLEAKAALKEKEEAAKIKPRKQQALQQALVEIEEEESKNRSAANLEMNMIVQESTKPKASVKVRTKTKKQTKKQVKKKQQEEEQADVVDQFRTGREKVGYYKKSSEEKAAAASEEAEKEAAKKTANMERIAALEAKAASLEKKAEEEKEEVLRMLTQIETHESKNRSAANLDVNIVVQEDVGSQGVPSETVEPKENLEQPRIIARERVASLEAQMMEIEDEMRSVEEAAQSYLMAAEQKLSELDAELHMIANEKREAQREAGVVEATPIAGTRTTHGQWTSTNPTSAGCWDFVNGAQRPNRDGLSSNSRP